MLACELCWGLTAGGIQRSSEITEEKQEGMAERAVSVPQTFSALGFGSHSGEGSLGLTVGDRKGTVGAVVISENGMSLSPGYSGQDSSVQRLRSGDWRKAAVVWGWGLLVAVVV